MSPKDLLLIGTAIRPHGLEGVLRIKSYAQSEESFLNAEAVFLQTGKGEPHKYKVLSIKEHKKVFLLKLGGIDSIEEAEKYRGAAILISKDSLPRERGEEYFWHELMGLKVYLSRGEYIGRITHVLTTGSNDIYVVREGKKEVLIPAIYDVVKEINLTKNRMVISEVEGLLDLNNEV